MTMQQIARRFGVKPAHLASAMGCTRQWMIEINAETCTFRTLTKVCAGFAKMGVDVTPVKIYELLQQAEKEAKNA